MGVGSEIFVEKRTIPDFTSTSLGSTVFVDCADVRSVDNRFEVFVLMTVHRCVDVKEQCK